MIRRKKKSSFKWALVLFAMSVLLFLGTGYVCITQYRAYQRTDKAYIGSLKDKSKLNQDFAALDLIYKQKLSAFSGSKEEMEGLKKQLQEEEKAMQEAQVMPTAAASASASASAFASVPVNIPLASKKIVCLDPGHQGSWVDMSAQEPDGPGSSEYKVRATTGTDGNYTGIPEYQLNLDISLALEAELTNRGYQVIMTRRDNDTAISNMERAQMANESNADAFIRIHANSSSDSSVMGAEALVPSPQNPYVAYLSEESYRLGQAVLDTYCQETGMDNRGTYYHDNMSGINWSQVPVMILEMGYMSNPTDDANMADPSYRQRMVQGIANGIDVYFSGR